MRKNHLRLTFCRYGLLVIEKRWFGYAVLLIGGGGTILLSRRLFRSSADRAFAEWLDEISRWPVNGRPANNAAATGEAS